MLKRLQQRLYRLIVPDSALSGWRYDDPHTYHVVQASEAWSLEAWVKVNGSFDFVVNYGTDTALYVDGKRIAS